MQARSERMADSPRAPALFAVLLAASLFRAPTLAAQEEAEDGFPPDRGAPATSPISAAWPTTDRSSPPGSATGSRPTTRRAPRIPPHSMRAPGSASGERATPRCGSARRACGRIGGSTRRWSRSGWSGSATSGWATTPNTIDDLVTEDDAVHSTGSAGSGTRARAEVTRRIRGPFHAALCRADWSRCASRRCPDPSLFVDDFGEGLEQDDVSGRLALIYDTRDNEFNTLRGVLAEAGAQVGSGGDGYTRLYGVVRGYVPVREGTTVAARGWWRPAWAARRPSTPGSTSPPGTTRSPCWAANTPTARSIPAASRARARSSATSRSGTTCCPSAISAR